MSKDYTAEPAFSNAIDPFEDERNDGPSEFEKLLAQDKSLVSAQRLKPGTQVSGKVIQSGPKYVFVDLGGKSSAALAVEDYTTAGAAVPHVGDEISAYVRVDNGSEVILTRSIRRSDASETTILQALESGLPIEGKVEKVIKGGFEVSVAGKRGFVPLSHMDSHVPQDPEKYLGNVLPFLISEYKNGGRQFVLSRRVLLKNEQNQKLQQTLSQLEVGQTHSCKIARFAPFGAFVELDGMDALLPISEMSWTRITNPEAHFKVGQTLSVKVIRIEKEPKIRIAVSFKEAHPELKGSLKKGADSHAGEIEQETAWAHYQAGKSNQNHEKQPLKTNKNESGNILAEAFLMAESRKKKK